MPTLTWCYNTITDEDRWARPGPGMRPHEGAHAAVGLVLVLDGTPVAMGMSRAALVLAKHSGAGDVLFAAWRRGDQNLQARTGRWWLDWYEASAGDRGFAGGATYGHDRSYGDYGASCHVPLPRPKDVGDGWALDAWALAATIAHIRGARVVLLRDGREVTDGR